VLNIDEERDIEADVEPAERADRAYWEKKASPEFLTVIDKINTALQGQGLQTRLTYNIHHIALGTTGYNFCWFNRRKLGWHINCRVNSEIRDQLVSELQASGINANPYRTDRITFLMDGKKLETSFPVVLNVLKQAEEWSKR
jgi:hypothetical protein